MTDHSLDAPPFPYRWVLFLGTGTLLSAFYLFQLNPAASWVQADDAMPYLMANSSFAWSDFFIWTTRRFGMPYAFLAKFIYLMSGSTIAAESFYRVYVVIVLFGISSLWFLPLHPALTLSAIAFFLPMTEAGVRHILIANQPYGILILYCSLGLLGVVRKNPYLILAAALFLFLQYPPMLLFGIVLAAGSFFQDPDAWKRSWRSILAFAAAAALLVMWLKSRAVQEDGFSFFAVQPYQEALVSLKTVFLQYGLFLDGQGAAVGVLLLVVALAVGLGSLAENFRWPEAYWPCALLFWSVGGLAYLALNKWFLLNLRDPRFINAITIGTVFFMVAVVQRGLMRAPFVFFPLLFLLAMKQMPLLGGRIEDRAGGLAGRMREITDEAAALGCRGVIGKNHWDTVFIGAATDMKIIGSTYPFPPNSLYLRRVLARNPLCMVHSDQDAIITEKFRLPEDYRFDCPKDETKRWVSRCRRL